MFYFLLASFFKYWALSLGGGSNVSASIHIVLYYYLGFSDSWVKEMNHYLTIAAEAEEFFLRVIALKEDTLENRLKILEDMAQERKVFKQTDEQIKKRITGKRILHVKPRKE